MVSFPGPIRLSTEPSQFLAHEGPGCDAGDSSHSETLIDGGFFVLSKNTISYKCGTTFALYVDGNNSKKKR